MGRDVKLSDKAARIRISLILTKPYVDFLDGLVNEGLYMERQTAIRAALRLLFQFHRLEPFQGPEGPPEVDPQEP